MTLKEQKQLVNNQIKGQPHPQSVKIEGLPCFINPLEDISKERGPSDA